MALAQRALACGLQPDDAFLVQHLARARDTGYAKQKNVTPWREGVLGI